MNIVQLDDNSKPVERAPVKDRSEIKKPIFDRPRKIVHIDPDVKVDPSRIYRCDDGQQIDFGDTNLRGRYEKYRI
jgi:hypothetical protein